jgi:hypothetical protein
MATHLERPYHVAIVGSGPSGFFAAASPLKAPDSSDDIDIAIDMLEMLPTPWGLVRSGVAEPVWCPRGPARLTCASAMFRGRENRCTSMESDWTGIHSGIDTIPRHRAQHHAGRLRRRPELWICRPQRDPSPTCKGSPSIPATPSINVKSKPRTRKGDSQCRCTTKHL